MLQSLNPYRLAYRPSISYYFNSGYAYVSCRKLTRKIFMRKVHALLGPVCLLFPMVGCKPEADRIRDSAAAAAAAVPPKEPEMPDQVAKTGVGVQGNSLDDIKGNDPRMLIAGPAKALFNTKEKIVFDIELPKSAQLFNALQGRDPKTHEEYMKEVVGQIKLPKLPAGKVYRYHPDTNELWVESEKPTEPSNP